MKTAKLIIILLGVFMLQAAYMYAQDDGNANKSPILTYIVSGDAFTGLKFINDDANNKQTLTYTTTGFNPVFIFKYKDKLIYEGEVEFQLRGAEGYATGEGLEVELEYSNIGYILNDYMIFRAGTFFSSMGIFEDWYHQRITNKMTSRPLGIGHGGLESGTDLGFNLRGALPLSSGKLSYSLDLTNGPRLNMGEEGTSSAGKLEWETINDNNLNKAIGGRIGYQPFNNASLEIGLSGQMSKPGDDGSEIEDVKASFFGADLSYNKDIEAIKGTLVFRSQFDNQKVDDVDYPDLTDTSGTGSFTFTNNASAWYAQLSYRPTMVLNKFFRRCEVVGRYCSLDNPEGSAWGADKTQFGMSLDFWISWNAVIKLSFEQDAITDADIPAVYILSMAMGF